MPKRAGRKSKAQTPAPRKERIYGSKKNPKGSAASEKSASKIKLDDKTMTALKNKLKEFKEKHPNKKNITLNDLKAVYRRGAGAYSKSHRPTITGGAPNTRNAWSMARVNKFLKKAGGAKVKAAYVQDDDLMKMRDGGEIKLLAPNGKPSNLNSEQWHLVRTPKFKAWFGDWENDPKNASKVVDENGEPLVCYHGTDTIFTVFDKRYVGSSSGEYFDGNGFYFTSDYINAKSYADYYSNTSGGITIPIVYSCFLNLKNPLIKNTVFQAHDILDDVFYARNHGYDGYIVLSIKEQGEYTKQDGANQIVAFEPNQIKLADGTNTTFDPNNEDIRFAKGGQTFNDKELLSKWKRGESIGFTATAHLKAKGLIPRSDGTKRKSPQYKKDGGKMKKGGITKNLVVQVANDIFLSKDKNLLPKNSIIVAHRYNDKLKAGAEGLFAADLEDSIDTMYGENIVYLSIGKNAKVKTISSTYGYLAEIGELKKPNQYLKEKYGYETYLDLDEHRELLDNPNSAYYEIQKKALDEMRKRGEDFDVLEMTYEDEANPHQWLITNIKDPNITFRKGGLVGGYEDLTDEWLSKKIEIFLDKVKPIKYYFVDPNTNTLTVGFDKYYSQDAAQKVYEEATSSKEFFHAPSVESTYDSKTGDLVFNIKLKKAVEYSKGGSIVYSAIFFDENEIVKRYGQVHPNLYSHHSTIEFKPQSIGDLPIGDRVKISIVGRLTTEKVDVLLVNNPFSKNKYPHITLSTSEGVKPFESNKEIEQNIDKVEALNDYLEGVVGYFDGSGNITKYDEGGEVDYNDYEDEYDEQYPHPSTIVYQIFHDKIKLDSDTRYVLSNEQEINLNDVKQDSDRSYKPKGLWYAFGSGWAEWTFLNMPNRANEYAYLHKIEVNDNILRLDTKEKCIQFTEEYSTSRESLNEYEPITIDWVKVAKKYSGVEVTNPREWSFGKNSDRKLFWLYGWDVPSGCIWDKDGIKKIELVDRRDFEYYQLEGYLRNIRIDPTWGDWGKLYRADFGENGVISWEITQSYFDEDAAKSGYDPNNPEFVIVQSMDRDRYSDTKQGIEGSKGEGAKAIASLFLKYSNLKEILYDDYSEGFWQKIGGIGDVLKREDFFNYFNQKNKTNYFDKGGDIEFEYLREAEREEVEDFFDGEPNEIARWSEGKGRGITPHAIYNLGTVYLLERDDYGFDTYESKKYYFVSINESFAKGGLLDKYAFNDTKIGRSLNLSDKEIAKIAKTAKKLQNTNQNEPANTLEVKILNLLVDWVYDSSSKTANALLDKKKILDKLKKQYPSIFQAPKNKLVYRGLDYKTRKYYLEEFFCDLDLSKIIAIKGDFNNNFYLIKKPIKYTPRYNAESWTTNIKTAMGFGEDGVVLVTKTSDNFYMNPDMLNSISSIVQLNKENEVIRIGKNPENVYMMISQNALEEFVDSLKELPSRKVKGLEQYLVKGGEVNQYFRAEVGDDFQKQKTFIPNGYYEMVGKDGNPVIKYDEYAVSNVPEVAASKTIYGAILGASSMLKFGKGITKNTPIQIYTIQEKPDVDISHWGGADFEYLDEVRYRKNVLGKYLLEYKLDDDAYKLVKDFYDYKAFESESKYDDQLEFDDSLDYIYEMISNGTFFQKFKKLIDKSLSKKTYLKGGEVDENIIKERWAKKKDSLMNIADNIRSLRTNLRKDLKGDDDKDRLTALAISLMDKTAERVGNNESEANGHLGITGLSKRNVKVEGNTITLKYIGKSGVKQEKQFSDEGIASALKDAIANSQSKYVFETSDGFRIKNDRINRYLNEYDISAKDLRGYSANQWIVSKLREVKDKEILGDEAKRKKKFNEIVKSVAEKVGHGAPTLKKHYMLPSLEREWVNNGKIVDLANIKRAFEDGGEIDEYKQGGVITIPNIESSLQTFYINHKLNYPYDNMALVNKMLKSLGKGIKVVKYLGGGSNGGAYLTSDKKVLKISYNEQEAYSSFVIFKNPQDFTTQAKVHDLFVINNLTKEEIKEEEEKSSRGFVIVKFIAKHDKTYFILKDFVDVLSLDDLEEDVTELAISGYARKHKFDEIVSRAIETIEDAYVENVKMSKEEIEKLKAYIKPYYDFGKKLEIEGKKYGLEFGDSGGVNMGYDSNNNLVCFDCLSESKYMLKKGGDVGVVDINQGANVVNNIDYDPLDETQDIPNDGEGVFKKGGDLKFNDIVLYHEKQGNWFVAKNTVYAWLYQDPNAAKKLESGEFEFVLFPPNPPMGVAMRSGYVPPLLKIWTKKYQKETKGADNLLGIVKGWYDEDNKKLYILMMTTRKDMRRKGVNSHIIKNLREEFNLDKDQIIFDKPTKEGEMFSKSGKYEDGGDIYLLDVNENIQYAKGGNVPTIEVEKIDKDSLLFEYDNKGHLILERLPYSSFNVGDYADKEGLIKELKKYGIDKGEKVWSIKIVQVKPRYRGQGVASTLLSAAIQWAKENDYEKLVLVVQAQVGGALSNEQLYELYSKFKFKPLRKTYGVNWMARKLSRGGEVSDEDKKETYKKWKSLVNMSKSELDKFYNSEEGKVAGLTASQAKSQGIDSGRESARWIMKMKDTSVKDWTPTMWKWAKKQISFVSRMSGNKGQLYDEKGNKTRKHTSLLIWGHNPKKKAGGGELDIPLKENAMNEITYNQLPAIDELPIGKTFVLKEHYYNNQNGKPTHQGCRYLIVENVGDAQMSDCLKLKVHGCYGGGGITTKGIITRPIKNIMNKGRDMGESLTSGLEKAYKKGGELDPDKKEVKQYFEHKSGAAGGLLVGKRHSEGGIQAINKSTGQPLEMEGGEVVITRDAVSDSTLHDFNGKQMTNREILSAINESGGGVKFADGGDVSCKCSGKEYKLGGKTYKDYELFKKINNSYGSKSAIEKGMKVEDKEHGETFKMLKNGEITYEQFLKKLVVDHLSENPKYYDK